MNIPDLPDPGPGVKKAPEPGSATLVWERVLRRKIPSGKVVFGLAPPSPRSLHGLEVHLLAQPQHLRGYLPSLAVLLSTRHWKVGPSKVSMVKTSVPDPDPQVYGPPGSGSISQRYGSGSGSFYHQAKIVWKTLIPTVLWLLLDFLSLKNYVNVPSKSNKQRNFFSN